MKFALVNEARVTPQPKLRGVCPNCGADMIAKCGRVKVWHWAHKGAKPCDPWWEAETDWHRDWKNHFPEDWQEMPHLDHRTGERHIADVRNPFGLVIEFQHSPIHPDELAARERYYQKMVWVVDGSRGGLDKSYFQMGLSREPIQTDPLAYAVEWWGRSRLLHNWSEAQTKVFLDFGDDYLWRLVLFDRNTKRGAVGPLAKTAFIEDCMSGTEFRVSVRPIDHDQDSRRT